MKVHLYILILIAFQACTSKTDYCNQIETINLYRHNIYADNDSMLKIDFTICENENFDLSVFPNEMYRTDSKFYYSEYSTEEFVKIQRSDKENFSLITHSPEYAKMDKDFFDENLKILKNLDSIIFIYRKRNITVIPNNPNFKFFVDAKEVKHNIKKQKSS